MVTESLESIHILHVDDEPEFADLAATFVEREDDRFVVETATSPGEALDRLAGGQFDCIVSDYDMPTQNGIGFLNSVREDDSTIPFILFTGKGSEEIASKAISAGVTDYLQKGTGPSQYTVLANRIKNAVESYHAQTELADREQRLKLFVEQSPLGVVEWDDEFNFVNINEAGEEILGYTQDDLAGHSWEKIVSESNQDPVGDVVAGLLENKGGYHSLNENVRKDGERIICEWHNRVVTDEDGSVVAIFSQFQDVTERVQQERENNRRRHRLEQIIKTVPGCVVQLDADGEFVFANERAEEVLGLERDEVTSRGYNDPEWDIRDLSGHPMADEELPFRRVRDTGTPVYGVKHTIQWPDGTRKVLLVNGAPLFDEDGRVDSVVFSLTDITDAQERELALERTQRRLELALNTTDTGVYEWNMETDEVVWNDSLERVMGLDPGEFEGTFEAFLDRIHPDDLARVREQIDAAVETESMYSTEFRMEHADGSYRWVEVRGRVMRQEGADRMVGVHHDITQRKDRETTVDRQRSLLEAQKEAMIDGLLVANEAGDIVLYNDRFVELWGMPKELLEEGDEAPVLDWATDQVSSPDQFRTEVEQLYANPDETLRDTVTLADGRVFDRYTAPVVGADGTRYGRLWTVRDITEQKTREAELKQQNERLEEFTRVVSHDLRSPLQTAQGYLDLVAEDADSDHVSSTANALDRMESIIDDLLSLAREGRSIGATESVALADVAEQAWGMTGADVADATLSVSAAETGGLGHVTADQDRLQRAFENLFMNAVEHGNDDITVTVGRLEDGFYIEDDGPGIPESKRGSVFDIGYSSTASGTGFGLNIVKQIVEAHGWTIRATDATPAGARFEITTVESTE